MKALIKKFKTFYRASPENRTGVHVFLGFVIIPFIFLSALFIIVSCFFL